MIHARFALNKVIQGRICPELPLLCRPIRGRDTFPPEDSLKDLVLQECQVAKDVDG